MAWGWSHTAQAYANAEANLRDLPDDDLREIWREWCALVPANGDADHEGYSPAAYELAGTFSHMGGEDLAERIWDRMSDNAVCDNGGFNAWACPYGCHTVSFDRETAPMGGMWQ